jgi:CheY-like chemotaxis protein
MSDLSTLEGKGLSNMSTLEGAARHPAPRRPVVLVVDDDADVRAVAGAVLRHHGFDSLPANGGRQAMSGYTNDYTEADLARMGASFVAKPFRSAELASAVRRALDA